MKLLHKGMFTACLFYPLLLQAQTEVDALRYSQLSFGSTARSLSMGGAFGALGADFSTLSNNPAGIGVYRKSEFTFSLGFENTTAESEFMSENSSDNRFNVSMPNLGLVFAFTNKKRDSDWKQFSFGLGYNRLASFQSNSFFEGKNPSNSLLDNFIQQVHNDGGATPEDLFYYYPFDVNLAYQTYLLDPDPNDSLNYVSAIPYGGEYQSRSVETRGSMGEFVLTFGGNYNDKVFWGVTMGFPGIRYEERAIYEETDKDNQIVSADSSSDFKSFSYHTFLKTTGRGINGKFGLIFKPANFVRIGAAIHTPTYFYMSDGYDSQMSSSFANGISYYQESPIGNYNYTLTTPFRAIGSLAFIFGKAGLLSFDYEYTDYTDAHFRANDYSFSSVNRAIDNLYNPSVNIFRAGTEWKYGAISFRGGAAYYSPAFNSKLDVDTKIDQHSVSYTGGIGFRGEHFYTDLGYGYTRSGDFYRQYTLDSQDVPGATTTRTSHRVIWTVGFRF
ncbi:MAG TPA: hypothetical protein VFW78_10200 [Bacteroidia bacterium]|nr:hypothetical protein [Bacteroidia bacterium]